MKGEERMHKHVRGEGRDKKLRRLKLVTKKCKERYERKFVMEEFFDKDIRYS